MLRGTRPRGSGRRSYPGVSACPAHHRAVNGSKPGAVAGGSSWRTGAEKEPMTKQGVLPYVVEILKRSATITAWAGLPLVLETMRALGLNRLIREHVKVRERERGYSEAKKV